VSFIVGVGVLMVFNSFFAFGKEVRGDGGGGGARGKGD